MLKATYKLNISNAITELFHAKPEVWLNPTSTRVEVRVESHTGGITYKQIMALRDIFGAEFDIEMEHEDGVQYSDVTWGADTKYLTFIYRHPETLV